MNGMYASKKYTFNPLVSIQVYFRTPDTYSTNSTTETVRLSLVRTCNPKSLRVSNKDESMTYYLESQLHLYRALFLRNTKQIASFPRRAEQTWKSKVLKHGKFYIGG